MGIGGPCSALAEWTPYSGYMPEYFEVLSDGCNINDTDTESSGAENILPSTPITLMFTAMCVIMLYLYKY